MNRRTLIAAGTRALCTGWAGLGAGLATAPVTTPASAQATLSAVGAQAPLPTVGAPLVLDALGAVPLLGGGRFTAAQAQGRVLVLYWWASWCPFCAVQSPEVDKLWRAQSGRGLQMLTLSIDRQAEDAAAYLKRRGYAFPAAWVTPELARALPKPKGLPVTVVRGRDGRVLMAEAGQLFPEDVEGIARFLG
jgi:thiol-disulfide isomerase/thioredoxin